MNSNWRPSGWENPYSPEEILDGELFPADDGWYAYEDGASAIIPAVREATFNEIAEWMTKHCNWIILHIALLQGKMPEEVKNAEI